MKTKALVTMNMQREKRGRRVVTKEGPWRTERQTIAAVMEADNIINDR